MEVKTVKTRKRWMSRKIYPKVPQFVTNFNC